MSVFPIRTRWPDHISEHFMDFGCTSDRALTGKTAQRTGSGLGWLLGTKHIPPPEKITEHGAGEGHDGDGKWALQLEPTQLANGLTYPNRATDRSIERIRYAFPSREAAILGVLFLPATDRSHLAPGHHQWRRRSVTAARGLPIHWRRLLSAKPRIERDRRCWPCGARDALRSGGPDCSPVLVPSRPKSPKKAPAKARTEVPPPKKKSIDTRQFPGSDKTRVRPHKPRCQSRRSANRQRAKESKTRTGPPAPPKVSLLSALHRQLLLSRFFIPRRRGGISRADVAQSVGLGMPAGAEHRHQILCGTEIGCSPSTGSQSAQICIRTGGFREPPDVAGCSGSGWPSRNATSVPPKGHGSAA